MSEPLCESLLGAIDTHLERTIHLLAKLPPDEESWIAAHLMDCAAGFCAVLLAAEPVQLQSLTELKAWSRIACTPVHATERLKAYAQRIREGFSSLTDGDLARRIPTVFSGPEGETILTLFLGNIEHLTNHKRQLFELLRNRGVTVTSPDQIDPAWSWRLAPLAAHRG